MSAEEHLIQLAENIPEVVWITDPACRAIWYISPAYERIWGRSCASLYESPRSWTDALHPEDRDRVLAALAQVSATGQFDETYRIVRPDGTLRWVSDRGRTIRTADGTPLRFVGIADDITTRVAADAQLREAKALAEAADHARSAFLAAMSHELRTPLTAIIGFSELLEDGTGGPLTERQRKYVGNILGSGRALLDLIDQVLDIARVEVGRLTLSLTPIEMGELLDDVAMLVRPLAAKKQITLLVALSEGLPKITADAPKVKQVVFGLLANSVRHTPDMGEVTVRATRRVADVDGTPGEWIEVAVTDTGPGIPAARRAELLNNFAPAASGPPTPRSSTGVSLALARKLIELHGGRMWLEGDGDTGTTVKFVLPQAARPVGARVSPIEPMRVPETGGESPVVLIVEDDIRASDLLAHYMEEGGYRVARAYTVAQALAMAEHIIPFAITIDPALPDGDGLDLLRRIRATQALAHVPVVVVSVSAPREDVVHLGAIAWIVKPVNRAELLGVLRRQKGGVGSQRGHREAGR